MKSRLRALKTRWQSVPAADRRRYFLVSGMFLAGLLALFHGLVTSPALTKAQDDLSRIKGRASQLGKQVVAPPVPRLSGKSPGLLAKEVKGLEGQLNIQRARLVEFEPRFASLDDMAAQEQLRLELTALASRADLELLKLEQKGIRKEEKDLAPSPERLRALAEANPYKRPLLRFEARASYRGLMQFLDGLATLSYTVSPAWISVEVKTDAKEGQAPRQQWLEVALDLAL
jgi:hypothetical protein